MATVRIMTSGSLLRESGSPHDDKRPRIQSEGVRRRQHSESGSTLALVKRFRMDSDVVKAFREMLQARVARDCDHRGHRLRPCRSLVQA